MRPRLPALPRTPAALPVLLAGAAAVAVAVSSAAAYRSRARARSRPATRTADPTGPSANGSGPGPRTPHVTGEGGGTDPHRTPPPPGARPAVRAPGGALRAWAELLRLPALCTVPGDALAGAAASGARPGRRTLLAIGSSVCLYEAGMALNDWADRAEDAVQRPHRPLPSGRIRPSAALAAAGALTVAGLALAAGAGRPALAVAGGLTAAVWAYDLGLKHTPAGPFAMGAARALDLLLGAAATNGRVRPALASAALLGTHTWTVTTVSRHEAEGGSTRAPLAALAITAALMPVLSRQRSDGPHEHPPAAARPDRTTAPPGATHPADHHPPAAPDPRGTGGHIRTGTASPRPRGSGPEPGPTPKRSGPGPATTRRALRNTGTALSRSSTGATQGGTRPAPGNARPAAGSAQPVAGSARTAAGTARSVAGTARTVLATARSAVGNAKPALGSGRPAPSNARPPLSSAGAAPWSTGAAPPGRAAAVPALVPAPLSIAAEVGTTVRDLLGVALGAEYFTTVAGPLLHAALNPSPPLTQRAVGAGIRATIPLQAVLTARAGRTGTALFIAALAPAARTFARKVSVT